MAKELPTDAKTERLLNLVLALLASRRFMRKSEILATIPGYEGSPESRERMFERDKDELRKIGIPIQVSQIDPLFEDEVGYRIPANEYLNDFPNLTSSESLIASLAIRAVSDLLHEEPTKTVELKIDALAQDSPTSLHRILGRDPSHEPQMLSSISILIQAIKEHEELRFLYERDRDGERAHRLVEPLRLYLRGTSWQLFGWDVDRADFRNFLVDQIIDEPRATGRTFGDRKVPDAAGQFVLSERVVFQIPAMHVPALECEGARILSSEQGIISMEISPYNMERFLRILISLSPRASVLEPKYLQAELTRLREVLIDALR